MCIFSLILQCAHGAARCVTMSGNESVVTVLFEFKGSRTELDITPSNICTAIEEELGQMGFGGAVVTLSSKICDGPDHFFIQRWCKKWDAFVNLNHIRELKERDKITVTPNPSNPSSSRSTEVGM